MNRILGICAMMIILWFTTEGGYAFPQAGKTSSERGKTSEASENATVLKLGRPFMNHMVLQQKQPIPVWGTSVPNESVTVKIGTQTKLGRSSADGSWRIVLDAMVPGGTLKMNISTAGGEHIILEDILVGEVWLCAGQSNMEFKLGQAAGGKEAVLESNHPEIRLFNLSGMVRPDPVAWDLKSLERLNKLDFFEGKWVVCAPETSASFSAIGYFFGATLAASRAVPVGLIELAVGGAPAEAFVARKRLDKDSILKKLTVDWKNNELVMDWCRQRALQNLANSVDSHQRHPFEPSYIFETGVSSLEGFPIKGVIWYQGESNAENSVLYERLLPALVDSWREGWKSLNLPFYFAQLSGLERKGWPEFRDTQRRLAKTISTSGMVVTFDLGDSLNVHPARKKEVGERFAALALHELYGNAKAPVSPEMKKLELGKDRLVLIFDDAGILKTSDGAAPREIEVAGADGIFKTAQAEIVGNKLVVDTKGWNPNLIRYGWKPFSRGNLVNGANLPVATFKYIIDK